VTGASSGIGEATALALVEAGFEVIGTSRNTAKVAPRDGVTFLDLDVSSDDSVATLVRQVVDRFGRIDVLVNNAGIYEGVADNAPDDEWHSAWHRTLTINLQAAADLSRLAVSHFLDRGGGGRIVNVISRASYRGDSPQHWHYAASKAALAGVIKTIARGYAADGILCFGVAPGFTVSEMTEEYLAGRGGAKIVADIPLGRVSSTDEVAEAIRWLATEAPAASTGSVIDVNGASYVR